MKRETQLRERLRTLGQLHEAVTAMKSLSAGHFRTTRNLVPAARDYRLRIEEALSRVSFESDLAVGRERGLLAVGADLGLCRDYNSRLAQAALDRRRELGPGPLYCIGRRMQSILARAGATARRVYPAPASSNGLTELLLNIGNDIFDDYRAGTIGGLDVVSAHFEGAGHFSAVSVVLLPIVSSRPQVPLRPTRYVSQAWLVQAIQHEFLYITLYELLLEALASEHGTRLLAAQSAEDWLDARSDDARMALTNLRRETATQEVLDVAAGARAACRAAARFLSSHDRSAR